MLNVTGATPDTLRQLFELNQHRIFRVDFIKRTNRAPRRMVCRLGVRKNVTGRGRNFDPAAYDLLSVYDVQKGEHRFINLRKVRSAAMRGETYNFV